jgi:hypothetical protein
MNTSSPRSITSSCGVRRSSFGGAVLATFILGSSLPAADFQVEAPVLAYTPAQHSFGYVDSPLVTLKRDATTLYTLHTATNDSWWRYGTVTAPLQTQVWKKTQNQLFSNNESYGFRGIWIQSIYKDPSTGNLVAFTHNEREVTSKTDVYFSIGIAYSSDGGNNWNFCGEIVKNAIGDNPGEGDNIGGTPFIIVGNYFYIYFKEHPNATSEYFSVARALVTDVYAAATNGNVTAWNKYNSGAWNQNGLTGTGSALALTATSRHTDTVRSTALNKYLMAASESGALKLYSSIDGLTWTAETTIVTYASGLTPAYPCFIDHVGANDDGSVVDGDFYVYWSSRSFSSNLPDNNKIWRSRITIGAPTTLLADNFEDGNATGWTVEAGNWSVVTAGSKVYKQSNTAAGRSVRGSSSWIDYTVQAKIKPLSTSGGTALNARYANFENRYFAYLTSGAIYIKKSVGGIQTTLASKNYTINANAWYNVELACSGNTLILYLNGIQQLSATDSSFASGKIALSTYLTAAEFDDVEVTEL